MSFWQAFMSVYHDYPWMVFAILGCSLVINVIFFYVIAKKQGVDKL